MGEPMKLITLQEAADRLAVSKTTLRRWDVAGTLKAVRTVGNYRRYRESDIIDFVRRQGGEGVDARRIEAGDEL